MEKEDELKQKERLKPTTRRRCIKITRWEGKTLASRSPSESRGGSKHNDSEQLLYFSHTFFVWISWRRQRRRNKSRSDQLVHLQISNGSSRKRLALENYFKFSFESEFNEWRKYFKSFEVSLIAKLCVHKKTLKQKLLRMHVRTQHKTISVKLNRNHGFISKVNPRHKPIADGKFIAQLQDDKSWE